MSASPHDSATARAGWADWLAPQILRHRRRIVFFALAATAIAGVGIGRVQISHDTRIFFGAGNPEYREFRAFEETFGRSDTLIFLLVPAEGTVYAQRALSVLAALTDAAWEIPHARRVTSLANAQTIHGGEDALGARFFFEDPAELTEADLAEIERMVMETDALDRRLVSPDGDVAGVFVALEMPTGGIGREPVVAEAAHRAAATLRAMYPDMEIRMTGSVMLAEAFGEASRKNLRTLVPLSILVMIVVLAISLRCAAALAAAGATIMLSVVTGLGLAGWIGIPLTAVSVSGPVLIVTLAIADCVHLLRSFLQGRRTGLPGEVAMLGALRANLRAIFLTSSTTAIGFFCLNFSESPPFRHLGSIVGMGVAAAFLYAVLFLPALLSTLPMAPGPARAPGRLESRMARVAGWIVHRPRRIRAGLVLLVGVAALGLPHIELNDKFIEYFDESFAVRRDTEFLIESLGGADSIEYAFDAGAPGGIADPDYIEMLDRFADWQRRQPQVVAVHVLSDTLKRMNRAFLGLEEERLPETREEVAQLLFLHELSLPPELDLGAWVSLDHSASRGRVVYESLSARAVREAAQHTHAWIDANVGPPWNARGTGLSLIWAHITLRNTRSMLAGSLLALTLVSLLMSLPLRDVRLGLISLVPNLLPPVMALGIWGLVIGRIGLALSVVVAMTIGIVVDDTIHFLIQYQRARRQLHMEPGTAIVHVFHTVGAALCTTTAALVGGFLVLCLSPYRVSFEVGLLCALILTLALCMDLLLLPTLLLLADRPSPAPATERDRVANRPCVGFRGSLAAFANSLRAALQLARPVNCLMSALAVLLGAWVADVRISPVAALFAMACGAFITAGGNVLNDVFDIESDRFNHPDRPLPSDRIRPGTAQMLALLFLLAGVISGMAARTACGLVAGLAVALLFAYEAAGWKRAGLPGNLIIGILTGLLFLAGGAAAGHLLPPVSLGVLAALATTGREIIKDIEDVQGDTNRRTLPMRIGRKRSADVAKGFLALAILLSPVPWMLGVLRAGYLPLAGLSLLLFLRAMLRLSRDPHAAARSVKQAMAVVLLAFLAGIWI